MSPQIRTYSSTDYSDGMESNCSDKPMLKRSQPGALKTRCNHSFIYPNKAIETSNPSRKKTHKPYKYYTSINGPISHQET